MKLLHKPRTKVQSRVDSGLERIWYDDNAWVYVLRRTQAHTAPAQGARRGSPRRCISGTSLFFTGPASSPALKRDRREFAKSYPPVSHFKAGSQAGWPSLQGKGLGSHSSLLTFPRKGNGRGGSLSIWRAAAMMIVVMHHLRKPVRGVKHSG